MSAADLTGHVSPDGPSWVLDLGPAVVRKCSVGPMDNNAYLVTCTATGTRLLVDAADDAPRLHRLLAEDGATDRPGALDTVLTTHRHQDHHQALAEMVRATGATTVAGADDADALPVPVDTRVEHGDRIRVGDLELDVVALRGHTPGSVALALGTLGDTGVRTTLFTGDSLFPGGPGKTGSPEDFGRLMDDLEERVFGVYDDALVLPGHGDNTTLGAERDELPGWRERGW